MAIARLKAYALATSDPDASDGLLIKAGVREMLSTIRKTQRQRKSLEANHGRIRPVRAVDAETRAQAGLILGALDPKDALALALYFEGAGHDLIGEALGVKAVSAKARVHRAIGRARDMAIMGHDGQDLQERVFH